MNTTRYEGPEIDDKIVENDARVLKKAVARKHKSDDQTLIQIFTDRSRTHLVALRSTYRSMFGKELGKVIIIVIKNQKLVTRETLYSLRHYLILIGH